MLVLRRRRTTVADGFVGALADAGTTPYARPCRDRAGRSSRRRGRARCAAGCRVPGDKGISHRALLFAALAGGRHSAHRLGTRRRRRAGTRAALTALGVRDHAVTSAASPCRAPASTRCGRRPGDIDCGNSGTTMRMLAGLVAGRPFLTVLTGDASLSTPADGAGGRAAARAWARTIDGAGRGSARRLTIRGGALTGTAPRARAWRAGR